MNSTADSVNRVPCEVPGCRRTIGADVFERRFKVRPGDWICQDHWRSIPIGWKRVINRHKREWRKYGFYPREEAYHRAWDRIYRLLGIE